MLPRTTCRSTDMKVVLFCGGQGLRLRDYSENVPKPMVPIGYRPILWHLMKYYAHYGHKDFILCLGHQADVIKRLLPRLRGDAHQRLRPPRGRPRRAAAQAPTSTPGPSPSSTPASTSNIGQRLMAVREHLAGRGGLPRQLQRQPHRRPAADADRALPAAGQGRQLPQRLPEPQLPRRQGRAPTRASSRSCPCKDCDLWINGGFFVFKQSIFDYMREGEELVLEPFQRLIREKQLTDLQARRLLGVHGHVQGEADARRPAHEGQPPWQVWRNDGNPLPQQTSWL